MSAARPAVEPAVVVPAASRKANVPVLETLFVLACAAIVGWQLFLRPVVGIADNSDFLRIIGQVGLYPVDYPGGFTYYTLHYTYGPRLPMDYLSSQLLLCEAAIRIHRLFGSGDFDLRFLGLVCAAGYLAALGLFARGLPLATVPKALFLAAAVFLLVDVRITSYFNSFYSESAAVVFLLCTLACMLLLGRESPSVARLTFALAAFLCLALLLGFSKTQNLVLLAPLWLFGTLVALRHLRPPGARLVWVGVSAILLLGGIWWGVTSRAYALTRGTNIERVWREEIVPHSPDQQRDWEELSAGTGRITTGRIALFYLRHPIRYLQLLERRAGKAFSHLAHGNFTKADARRPYQQSDKFTLWWRFKSEHFPKRLWFIAGTLAVAAAVGCRAFLASPARPLSHLGLVTATLSSMAAGAFLVSATFEANGPEKHLFLFNVLFDLSAALGLALILSAVPDLRTARTPG